MLRVSLSPSPGFCIKSTCTQDGIYDVPVTDEGPAVSVPAQKGLKVFVNICYDESIPPPPEGSEDVIQRAMRGEDTSLGDNAGWFVPVVVSNGREDKDKGTHTRALFVLRYGLIHSVQRGSCLSSSTLYSIHPSSLE